MSATSQPADAPGEVRATADAQLGGDAQLYYDVERDEPVALRQHEGWGLDERDYLERTWLVQCVRCYVGDAECRDETITQSQKLGRVSSGRYRNVADEDVDDLLAAAAEANREWAAVHAPHIPLDGEGGVNVYVDGEKLRPAACEDPDVAVAREDTFGTDTPDRADALHVRVEYDQRIDAVLASAAGPEGFEPCERVGGDDEHRYRGPGGVEIELRHDTECVDPHEWEPGVEPVQRGEQR